MNLFSYIKDRLSIVDVISSYISIKKNGLYYKALCPFHNERTPSFIITEDKGFFYCFGCHIGGDIITFVSKIENLSNKEALYFLIDKYNIDISGLDINFHKDFSIDKKDLYIRSYSIISDLSVKYRYKSNDVNRYLLNRGFSIDTLDEFKVGYVPSSNILLNDLIKFINNDFDLSNFIEAKILFKGANGIYTPFENRIIFPIYNILSKVIAFGGRIFNDSDNRVKYYNSHDHEFFSKGAILYNLDKAKTYMKDQGAILVEGYTDVLSLYQASYKNVIATLGTACTANHLSTISRYTKRLYILYDGDIAGYKAILRLASISWNIDLDIYVIKLPKDEDPSSLILNYGSDYLSSLILNANDILSFFINEISKDFFSKNLSERLNIVKGYLSDIRFVSDHIKRDLLINKASEVFKIPYQVLKDYIIDNVEYNNPVNNFNTVRSFDNKKLDIITQLEKKIFCAIIFNYNILSKYDEYLISNLLSKDILALLIKLKGDYKDKIDSLNDNEKALFSKIIIEFSNISESLDELLFQFYRLKWKFIVYYVKKQIKDCEIKNDNQKIRYWLSYLENIRQKIVKRGNKIDE
jgi:DNA primase